MYLLVLRTNRYWLTSFNGSSALWHLGDKYRRVTGVFYATNSLNMFSLFPENCKVSCGHGKLLLSQLNHSLSLLKCAPAFLPNATSMFRSHADRPGSLFDTWKSHDGVLKQGQKQWESSFLILSLRKSDCGSEYLRISTYCFVCFLLKL